MNPENNNFFLAVSKALIDITYINATKYYSQNSKYNA